jgi:glycosyltransferase involved in cell wall biosynthesis
LQINLQKEVKEMKIALIGTRGIPANYGGFETCAEEIAVALAAKGHAVTVYCRYGNAPGNPTAFKGVSLKYVPSINTKILGTFSHAFFSLALALFKPYDILMVFNAGNSPLCLLPKLFLKKIAVNVDGLEWKRKKWGWYAKQYYQFAEFLSTKLGDRIVSDSQVIQKYYIDRFRTESTFIAYGAHIESSENAELLTEYNVKPMEYLFIGSRLEPENNADLTVRAFEGVKTDKKLLIAGGANYKSAFINELRKTSDKRIKFLGPIYKPGHMKELHCGAYAYIHGNEVGGTNPALLKAMGYGNCVLAYNVSYNAEVVGSSAILYEKSVEDLRQKIQYIIDHPEKAALYRSKAVARVQEAYTWEKITTGYERMFFNILKGYYKKRRESD